MRPRHPSILLALLFALAAGNAFAADSPQACRADARKLCAGMQPGGGRVLTCLQEHVAELSSDCTAALPTLQRCAKEMHSVCGDSGRRGLRECVRKNADKLSPECRGVRNP